MSNARRHYKHSSGNFSKLSMKTLQVLITKEHCMKVDGAIFTYGINRHLDIRMPKNHISCLGFVI